MFEAQIKVTLKKTVADPQGQTVRHALESLGIGNLEEVRMGKFITLRLKEKEEEKAKAEARKACEKLLANPIIEDFNLEVVSI